MVLETASRVSDEAKAEALETEEPATEAAPPREGASDAELIPPRVLALLRKGLPALWLLAVIAAGVVSGIELAFLIAAAGVVVLVIVLMWTSVQSLTGSASLGFEEALGMGAPSKVEEQKRSVLRALKDLEFERSVGKISAEDYSELSAKYRAEAKRLMQTLDDSQGPARAQVEALLAKRLRREGLADVVEAKLNAEPAVKGDEPAAPSSENAPADAPEAPSAESSEQTEQPRKESEDAS